MKVFQNADGGTNFSIREYDIAKTTKVMPGQVVQISQGLVTPAVAGQTGAVLGIAAEAHSGTPDALNIRSNGERILIYDNPGLMFRCMAPKMTATGGTATSVTANTLAAFAADDFKGGFLMLIKKGAGSGNKDPEGKVRRITGYAYNSTGTVSTFTLESGAAAGAGDEFLVFPPVGFAKGNLSVSLDSLVLTGTASLALKVVGRTGVDIIMMAGSHTLA